MAEVHPDVLTKAKMVLRHLNNARKRAAMYPVEHPYVADSLEGLLEEFTRFFQESDSVTLSIADRDLYIEGHRLPEESIAYETLIHDLTIRGLTNITFRAGVSIPELIEFLVVSVAKPEDIEQNGGAKAMLAEKNLKTISLDDKLLAFLGPTSVRSAEGGEEIAPSGGMQVSKELHRFTLQTVIAAFADAQARQMVNLELVEGTVRLLVTGIVQSPEIYMGLSTVKSFHEYTFYHSVNVAILSLLMGAKLNCDANTMHRIGVAALLHDVGKVNIPEEIIDKPGALTDEEFRTIQNHSVDGAEILAEQRNADGVSILVAAQHHAHYDLRGYPNFQSFGRLHFISHLVTVADVYDALTSNRAYSKAMLPDRAMQIILDGRGTTFHPLLAKLFANLSGLFPIGSVVELDSGELAVVCAANSTDLFRPIVKLVTHSQGDSTVVHQLDLSEKHPDGKFKHSIMKSVDPAAYGINVAEFS
jgi:putative nucleotidyltransferase with HDIG domain